MFRCECGYSWAATGDTVEEAWAKAWPQAKYGYKKSEREKLIDEWNNLLKNPSVNGYNEITYKMRKRGMKPPPFEIDGVSLLKILKAERE